MLATGRLSPCQLPERSNSGTSRAVPVKLANARPAWRERAQRDDILPTHRLVSSCHTRSTSRNQRPKKCGAASPTVQASAAEPEGRHAILHDFCMIIPYSSIVFLAGLVSLFFGTGWRGAALAAAGALELWLTLQSLKLWRLGAEHRLYTALTAGLALCLSSAFFKAARESGAIWVNILLGVLSVLATLFLIHNVSSGGNPPKADPAYTAADAMRPHPTS